MKVAFVSQPRNEMVPPVQAGSVRIDTYEAARNLAKEAEVVVYAARGKGQPKVQVHDGVEYRRISRLPDRIILKILRKMNRGKSAEVLCAHELYHIYYIMKVARDIRRRKCDVVHIINFSQFAPIIRALNPNVKIVLEMTCEWLTQLDPAIVEPRLNSIDKVLGISRFITGTIVKKFPELEAKSGTVWNGRDMNLFFPSNAIRQGKRRRQILFVGRVSPEKGIHVLIDAFTQVAAKLTDVELKIVGPHGKVPKEFVFDVNDNPLVAEMERFFIGDYFEQLNEMVPQEYRDRIAFTGPVPHRDLLQTYRDADVFVFPSIWNEPSGNPPIEAMATGIPVVATKVGGIPEYVDDGTTGLLVPPGDAESLATGLMRLLEDDEWRMKMGMAGRERAVRLFSSEQFAKSLYEQYAGMLSSSKSPQKTKPPIELSRQ